MQWQAGLLSDSAYYYLIITLLSAWLDGGLFGGNSSLHRGLDLPGPEA